MPHQYDEHWPLVVVVRLPSCPTLCNLMECSMPAFSFSISQSLLRFMSIELVMLSNYLILYHPLLLLPSIFPSIRIFFTMSQLFLSGGQSIGASVSVSVILMKPLEPKPNTTASASGLRPPWLLPGQKVLQTGGSDWKYYSIEPVSTHFPLDDKKSKRII